MKIAIAAVITIAVGLGAVYGVYQFQESRLTPAELDAMRHAERKLIEAEQASEALDVELPEDESAAEPVEMAQANDVEPAPAKEWKQIDTPDFSETDPFYVKFACSMGDFVVQFNPTWSPNGVKRIHELVDMKFYDDCRFFRVIDGFMAQFGIPGDPVMAEKWGDMNIPDDPVRESNRRGYLSFAMAGANTRSTQLFINFGNNARLDTYGAGFPPIGRVVDGMDAVDAIYKDYGGAPSEGNGGRGPEQHLVKSGGNRYLSENFPKLDYIKKARFVEPVEAASDDEAEEAEAA